VTLDGTPAAQTGEQVSAALWDLKGQPGPLTFVDLDGASHAVWLTEYSERIAPESQRRGTTLRGKIELVEA
jgi:hypothetical protein